MVATGNPNTLKTANIRPVLLCSHARRMSALGQKQTLLHFLPMSALPPKADIGTLPLSPSTTTQARTRKVTPTLPTGCPPVDRAGDRKFSADVIASYSPMSRNECPLYPQKQTSLRTTRMSAKCQERTLATTLCKVE